MMQESMEKFLKTVIIVNLRSHTCHVYTIAAQHSTLVRVFT